MENLKKYVAKKTKGYVLTKENDLWITSGNFYNTVIW
jgi:hypothetical protein